MFTAHTSVLRFGASFVIATMLLLQASTSMGGYYDVVTNDNPIGYWRLGETSGTTAFDQTANALNGTYSGSLTLGVQGALPHDLNKAVDFSGGRVTVADAAPFHFALSPYTISIEMWVTADSLSDFAVPVIKTSTTSWSDGYGFYYEAGLLKFFVNGYTIFVGTPFSVSGTNFHQIVGTYVGGTAGGPNPLKLYVDGSLVAVNNSGPFTISPGTGNLIFGGAPPVSGVAWDGKIDEVSIYGSGAGPLTAEQVQAHYLAAIVPEPNALCLGLVGVGLVVVRRVTRR